MAFYRNPLDSIGAKLAQWLTRESPRYKPYTPSDYETLSATLQPGDIILVEDRKSVV